VKFPSASKIIAVADFFEAITSKPTTGARCLSRPRSVCWKKGWEPTLKRRSSLLFFAYLEKNGATVLEESCPLSMPGNPASGECRAARRFHSYQRHDGIGTSTDISTKGMLLRAKKTSLKGLDRAFLFAARFRRNDDSGQKARRLGDSGQKRPLKPGFSHGFGSNSWTRIRSGGVLQSYVEA
jgi:hypothetical protein